MRVGTYPTRNFATFGPSELRPPFTGASNQGFHLSFSLYSTGQVSDPIRHLTILQSLVFLLNSRPPLFTITSKKNKNIILFWVLLLPKLQSHFAEFLQRAYTKRLNLFNLSTCVGFSTDFCSYISRKHSKIKKLLAFFYFFLCFIAKKQIPSKNAFAFYFLGSDFFKAVYPCFIILRFSATMFVHCLSLLMPALSFLNVIIISQ